ncbi:MAG: hypothetical protein LBI03_05695 [Clostridiales bacterium]|jgi:hypothetical protein|nr:hypothetical protein [Clostridiales bacterium]
MRKWYISFKEDELNEYFTGELKETVEKAKDKIALTKDDIIIFEVNDHFIESKVTDQYKKYHERYWEGSTAGWEFHNEKFNPNDWVRKGGYSKFILVRIIVWKSLKKIGSLKPKTVILKNIFQGLLQKCLESIYKL